MLFLQMNRPFGASMSLPLISIASDLLLHIVDISANIKGAVSKPATQKILIAAAERGEITQKTYGEWALAIWLVWYHILMYHVTGKSVFFVANQVHPRSRLHCQSDFLTFILYLPKGDP